ERARRRNVGLEVRISPGGRRAGDVEAFLDGHRDAMQRPPRLALGKRRVGRACTLACPLDIAPDDGVEARIVFLNARQEVIEYLRRADLAVADEARDLSGGFEVQVHRARAHVDQLGSFVRWAKRSVPPYAAFYLYPRAGGREGCGAGSRRLADVPEQGQR